MFDKIKKLFGSKPEPTPIPKEKKRQKRTTPAKKVKDASYEVSEKDKATAAGEPYVAIIKMDVDPENVHVGSIELDWNDKFILNLIRSGYKIKDTDTENEIIDRWFQTICRNVVLEIYEQEQADPENRDQVIKVRNLGDGRTEVS